MGIDRKIKLFFVTYGRLLFITIISIIIFLSILKSINNYVKRYDKNNELTQEEQSIAEQDKKNEIQIKNYISRFVKYCDLKNIEEAYEMLSLECKKEKYNSLEEFQNKYILKIFNLKIDSFKIKKENNIYKVLFIEDMLVTGKTTSSKEINIKINNIDDKIYILD